LAGGYFCLGHVHAVTGRLDEARGEIELAITLGRVGGDVVYQPFAYSLGWTGQPKNWRGEYSEALPRQAECLSIAREHNLLMPLLFVIWDIGLALTGKGDYDEALARFEEGLFLSEKVGDEIYHHRLLNALGWLYSQLGDLTCALDLNRWSAEGARKRGDPETIANAEINLGDILLAKGDLASAQEYLDGVYRLANDPATSHWMKWCYSTHLFAPLGELCLAKGDPVKAGEFAEQCLEIATRTNSRKYLVKAYRLKGKSALVRMQWDEAEGVLRQALTIAEAIGNPTQLWKTHLTLGRLYNATKKPEQARQVLMCLSSALSRLGHDEPSLQTQTIAIGRSPEQCDTSGAERRQLTVLSCDPVESTALAAHLDPEDWREVVRGYQQACAEVIGRFHGYTAQYLGDGLLVYFGYLQAREDDAQRAIHAGFGMVDDLG
jgi:tetratricopeptide (TPR) repeat protein